MVVAGACWITLKSSDSFLFFFSQMAASKRWPGIQPWISINHIRDQLIVPAERPKKKKLWNKVVDYIRANESRVREAVKEVYGEEHCVWQWMPNIVWTPVNSSPPCSPGQSPCASPPGHAHHQEMSPYEQGLHWQGPAFGGMNKLVGSPPSSCLKVRHMFDSSFKARNWIEQVKEEILRRCSGSSRIVHIAVDTESQEGCVYIKALTSKDAGEVFKTLHGQWYKGNLVTAKYMREERYFERFPDSKYLTNCLRPK